MPSPSTLQLHGELPFVGREGELAAIEELWRSLYQSSEIRALIITGEAGVGKSRLVAEAHGLLAEMGGAVVAVRLYPESTGSIIPLIAQVLQSPGPGRNPMRSGTDATTGTVVASLRRLARLRATIITIEDVHLLSSEGLRELSTLMGALDEESIAVLITGRSPGAVPVAPVHAIMQPYLVAEIALHGLNAVECQLLWNQVGGSPIESAGELIAGSTAGNPLAIRSALRSLARTGGKGMGTTGGASPLDALGQRLHAHVYLLSEGMTAHCTPRERMAAVRLAALGELFSREAAEILLEDAVEIIELLKRGEILTETTSVSPALLGRPSNHPLLAFTHSLLHRHLSEPEQIEPETLLHLIASQAPLFTLRPYEVLAEALLPHDLPQELITSVISEASRLGGLLSGTSDWQKSGICIRVAERLLEQYGGAVKKEIATQWRITFLKGRLSSLHREPYAVLKRVIDELLELTAQSASLPLASTRAFALGMLCWKHLPSRNEVLDEVEEMSRRMPELRRQPEYAKALENFGSALSMQFDPELLERFAAIVDEALRQEDLTFETREKLMSASTFTLVNIARTMNDLSSALERMRVMEAFSEQVRIKILFKKASLLLNAAMFDAYVPDMEWAAEYYRDLGVAMNVETARVHQLIARLAFIDDPCVGELEMHSALEQMQPDDADFWRPVLISLMTLFSLLRNDGTRASELLKKYPEGLSSASIAHWNAVGVALDDPAMEAHAATYSPELPPVRLAEILASNDQSLFPEAVRNAHELLAIPIANIFDLKELIAAIEWTRRLMLLKIPPTDLASLSELRTQRMNEMLTWLAEPGREYYPAVEGMVARYREEFSPKERTTWLARAEQMRKDRMGRIPGGVGGRICLTLFGKISITLPDGTEQKFQGARIKSLLGVMVINETLEKHLSSQEFARMVAGEEVEIENARNIVKTSVHRLRESLGHDAILTDGDTPRLNMMLVEVDLLQLQEHLLRAETALRKGSPMQARTAMLAALALQRNEVPFPGLYDSFIEAAREDLETRMRRTTVAVARKLMQEQGELEGVELLRMGLETIPGDEELSELLREALTAQGLRVEAERVRLREADEI